MPTLFRGPEAVLGIVITAAALLVDFTRTVARLIARPRQPMKSARDLDDSITLLSNALDASKAALSDTENRLDESLARASTAEAALLGIGDTREAMRRARETTQDAEEELRRITNLLAEQRKRYEEVTEEKTEAGQTRKELEKEIKSRELEIKTLRSLADEAVKAENEMKETNKFREEELTAELQKKELELEAVRAERMRAEEDAAMLETQAGTVAEKAEAAEFALEETKRELERIQQDLDARQKDRELVDLERARAAQRSKETSKLHKMVTDMERELGELQSELRSRDQVVNEFAMEADELRSLLAARDAELRDVSSKLESATSATAEPGGDSKLSEMNLKEVKQNLDAEKLALSAEITKAELASFDISEKDIDPLDRIKKEMGAEGSLLQAGLRKAESTVWLEEHVDDRKDYALNDVLETLTDEGARQSQRDGTDGDVTSTTEEEQDEQGNVKLSGKQPGISQNAQGASSSSHEGVQTPLSESPQDFSGKVQDSAMESVTSGEEMVAKQAQMKQEEAGTKPKRRRGGPRRAREGNTATSDVEKESKPRRRRGPCKEMEGNTATSDVEKESKPRRRRGRPRKKEVEERP